MDKRFSGGFSHEQAGCCETFSLVQQESPAEESSSPSWEIEPIAFTFLADQLRDIESYDENLMITSSMPSNAEANSINID